YHHHPPPFLEVDLGGALQQILRQADRDTGTGGRARRYHEHAAGRVRAAARSGGEVTGRPVGHVTGFAVEPLGQVIVPVRVAERDPRLVEQGEPGGAGHDEVHRNAGVEQPPQYRGRVGRTGRAGHPDDPRHPAGRAGAAGRHPSTAGTAGGAGRHLDLGRLLPLQGVHASKISGSRGGHGRSTRSSSAKTNSAIPTNPFAVKNARFTRDRSSGRTIACSYPNATAVSTSPVHHHAPSPTSTPYQTNSPNVTPCTIDEATSANRTPYRAGTLCTPICRSTSTSWVA